MKNVTLKAKVLFSMFLVLMGVHASAQTTTKKVLYMTLVRNTSSRTTARLEGTEDFLGPIYNLETKRLFINGSNRTLTNVKGIRFSIEKEEVPDAIEDVEEDNSADAVSAIHFDLCGRPVNERTAARGIYMKGGRKFIKK